jgi:hypothetical protein
MAEFVNLISDISMTVKLGWLAVLVWGAAQFVWYERGRVPSDEIDTWKSSTRGWSLGTLLAMSRGSTDEPDAAITRGRPLSIAPAKDVSVHAAPQGASALGEAAGMALEHLLDADAAGERDVTEGTSEGEHHTALTAEEVRW